MAINKLKRLETFAKVLKHNADKLPVRENASFGRSYGVTILLCFAKTAKSNREKNMFLGSIVQYLGLSKSHYKPSLSRFPCMRVVNVWQRESIKSVSSWNGL